MRYLNSHLHHGVGSAAWTAEVFRRAWFDHDGPMAKVVQRLRSGFSVLAYLPGSMMDAAASLVQREVGSAGRWESYGRHPGANGSLEQIWQAPSQLVARIQEWLGNPRTERPNAIVMNMDRMFFDNNHGVIQTTGAQMALFSLLESIRHARTIGLADSTFGNLPNAVETAFSEHRTLEGIDLHAFVGLIPWELAENLGATEERPLDESVHAQLWMRLRWVEPVRAVHLMLDASAQIGGTPRENRLGEATQYLSKSTRPMSFKDPRGEFVRDGATKIEQERQIADVEKGFPASAVRLLKDCVIARYRAALGASNGREAQELAELLPGAVLFGPPGTGKTWLAQWMAVKIGIPVRVVSGADLRVRDFGGTERRIVELFREARRAAPCMLILDDADDLLKERRLAQGAVAGAEVATVNTFLQQLAGFDGRPTGVFVVVTSNQFDRLDWAVRDRLKLHIPVSYASDEDQVRNLVNGIATELNLALTDTVREALVHRFQNPPYHVRQGGVRPRGNRFSPREMRFAMLLLKSQSTEGVYAPTEQDVDRMKRYYTDLAQSPEIQELLNGGNL